MTLRVPYSDFALAATRFEIREAYVTAIGALTEITAVMKTSGRILYAATDTPIDTVREQLAKQGLHVFDGAWSIDPPDPEGPPCEETFVAAVSYRSVEQMPGIWMDAYPFQPSQVQVLRALYDEFRGTGEIPEIPFEEFVRLASPNVLIIGPKEIEGFASTNLEA